MKRLVFAAAICAAAGFCVHAEGLVPTQIAPWYDAGIRGYSAGDLPETIAEVGSWSKDEGVTATVVKPEEADAVIDLKAPTGKIAFTPATAPTTSAAAIETDVSFYAYEFEDMPSADNGSRTGFTAAQKQDGSYAFFGKSNGAWVEISNAAVPAAEQLSIKLRIELDTSATPAKARYLVNGNAMADANGATWLPVAETATAVGAAPVEYAGVGQVASLAADTVDKTRAIAWCKRNGDGVVTDIEYFATFADAKARIGEMGPADTMVAMQDLEIPLTPGETLSIDLTKFLNPENYALTPTGVDGYKIVDGTEGTTYTLEVYPIKGFGTAEAPFEIGTVAELKVFRDGVNAGKLGLAGEIYKQTADIDLNGETWVGIGDGANDVYPFKGVYDGGNHAVLNFAVSKDASYGGFFWEVRDATVQNLKLLNVTAEDGAQSVCGVGGMVYGSCTFKNVTLDGEIVGRYNVGGFSAYTGLNEGEQITFEACTNLAKIVNLWHCKVGAFGVYNGSNGNGSMLFKDCLNAGAVTLHHTQSAKSNNALASAGGYFGWFNKSDSAAFENCVNSGDVTVVYDDETYKGSGCSAGGFIGSVHSEPTNISFENCVNSGKIVVSNLVDTANANAGGFIGACTRPMSFEDCQSLGELEAVNTLSETAVCTATFVAANGGTAPTVAGEMTALADYRPLGGSAASPALSFATVENDVATFVTAFAKDTQYKVMQTGGTAVFELEAENDYISFDHALAGATYAITSKTGAVGTNDVDNVITFTALASVPTVVKPGEPIVCDTAEAASNAMAKAVFAPSDEVSEALGSVDGALENYCKMFTKDVVPTSDGKWAVEAFLLPPDWTNVVKSARQATLQMPIAQLAAWRSGDAPISVPLTNCVPGFYYSLYDGAAVTNLKADIRKKNCNALCLCDAEKTAVLLEVTPPAACTTSGFFTVGVLETPSVIPGETDSYTNIPHQKPTFPIPPGW